MRVTIRHLFVVALSGAAASVVWLGVQDGARVDYHRERMVKGSAVLREKPAPEEIGQRRWKVALARIEKESDPQRRMEILEELVSRPTDFQAALDFLLTGEQGKIAHEAALRLLRRWAEDDPLAAAEWLKNATVTGKLREEAIQQTALAWAGQSMPEAIRWATELPVEGERNSAVLQVAYESTRNAPVEALRLAAKLPVGSERDALVEHAVAEWTTSAPADAAEWAKNMTAGEMKDRTMVAVITTWSETDPVAAADMAVKSLPEGRALDDAVIGIVQRWMQKEPQAASAWVERFPEGALRVAALESVGQFRRNEVGSAP